MQFVMTAGKRSDLFIKTMDSIIENVIDFDKLNGYFLTIDSDNYEYEKDLAKERYPFFNEIKNVRGYMHYSTLNILWFEMASDDYIYHNEDDRVIIRRNDYLDQAKKILDSGSYQQVVISDPAQLKGKRIELLGEEFLEWRFNQKLTDEKFKWNNWKKLGPLADTYCELWPDFTLAPSIINRKWLVDNHLKFSKMYHFERNFGYRACDVGFKRVAFKHVSHHHLGLKESLYDILGRNR